MFETKKKKAIGIILWQGESLFDGERIMVIATGISNKSKNIKTGEMVQTYILRQDIAPIFARRLGEDFSTCGDLQAPRKFYLLCQFGSWSESGI